MKPWQNNANCANSDSETETEIEDAPNFCKGQWVWYRQDDLVPVRGRVTRDSLEKQDVHIILCNSGVKRVCQQKFVVAATPTLEFVQSDTKKEAALDIARKKACSSINWTCQKVFSEDKACCQAITSYSQRQEYRIQQSFI
jgi:hypothetical protein